MSGPTTFYYFRNLPQEVQNRIWQLHREHRGIRHYLTHSNHSGPATRHYTAIDIETDRFIRTILTRGTARNFWNEEGEPIRGESDAKVRLIGTNWASDAGRSAMSLTTASIIPFVSPPTWSFWSKKFNPVIRINYKTDVVVLESDFNCLQPLFRLQHRLGLPFRQDLQDHWLRHVQHLAVNTGGCRMGVERDIAKLPSLEQLYIVVYRDPECCLRRPRGWANFDKSLLNEHKFLPYDDFVNLHLSLTVQPCGCELNSYRSNEVLGWFQRAFDIEGVQDMKISIVADPY
ncbi:hypothetical protein F5Y01DRAFT_322048 [Xylaria sp. FL0043]|nr:hypothetical protein F5Y01DRAFT_322048 [Xylaria sp. FL0043]